MCICDHQKRSDYYRHPDETTGRTVVSYTSQTIIFSDRLCSGIPSRSLVIVDVTLPVLPAALLLSDYECLFLSVCSSELLFFVLDIRQLLLHFPSLVSEERMNEEDVRDVAQRKGRKESPIPFRRQIKQTQDEPNTGVTRHELFHFTVRTEVFALEYISGDEKSRKGVRRSINGLWI